MYYPEGMKARVNPVQWSKPHNILAPICTQDSNYPGSGFKIISSDHYTTTAHTWFLCSYSWLYTSILCSCPCVCVITYIIESYNYIIDRVHAVYCLEHHMIDWGSILLPHLAPWWHHYFSQCMRVYLLYCSQIKRCRSGLTQSEAIHLIVVSIWYSVAYLGGIGPCPLW